MFEEIINLLLQKKAGLREELEREFAERESKINALLEMAGYTPPVVDTTEQAPQGFSF